MKLLADMLAKGAYDKQELLRLRAWIDRHVGKRLDLSSRRPTARFNQSLAMYLIVRDLMADLNAVGGGFMSQLEWGSDLRGIPLPVADAMESLFNSTFDHNGRKPALPFATEADVQGLLTMLFMTLAVGRQPAAVHGLPQGLGAVGDPGPGREAGRPVHGRGALGPPGVRGRRQQRLGQLRLGRPAGRSGGEDHGQRVACPAPTCTTSPAAATASPSSRPAASRASPARLAYSELSGMFSLVWDQAATVDLPGKLAEAVANTSNVTWPHTWVVPKYATMAEYKQYAPANHFHVIWNLAPARCSTGWTWPTCCRSRPGRGARRGSKASTARCPCSTCSTAARPTPSRSAPRDGKHVELLALRRCRAGSHQSADVGPGRPNHHCPLLPGGAGHRAST